MTPALVLAIRLLVASRSDCYLVTNERIDIIPCNFDPEAISTRIAEIRGQERGGAKAAEVQDRGTPRQQRVQGREPPRTGISHTAPAADGATQSTASGTALTTREPPSSGGTLRATIPTPAQPGAAAPAQADASASAQPRTTTPTQPAQPPAPQASAPGRDPSQDGPAPVSPAPGGVAPAATAQSSAAPGTAVQGTAAQTGGALGATASPSAPVRDVPPSGVQSAPAAGDPRQALEAVRSELLALDAALASGSVGGADAVLARAAQAFAAANSPVGAASIRAAQDGLSRSDLAAARRAIAGAIAAAAPR